MTLGMGSGDDSMQDELVSEVESEEDIAEIDDRVEAGREGSRELLGLREHLESQGFEVELGESYIRFPIPAGRGERKVLIRSNDFEKALGVDFTGWRSLRKYDGIVHQDHGMIEVALRLDRSSVMFEQSLQKMGGYEKLGQGAKSGTSLSLIDPTSSARLTIGQASPVAGFLLGGRFAGRLRPPMTLRVESLTFDSSDSAEGLIEAVLDSLSLQTGMRLGLPIVPKRLESRVAGQAQRGRRAPGVLTFPASQYPHAPIVLYRMGKDWRSSSIFRYWAFYQVLEYFFPSYSRSRAIRQLSQLVQSPVFDPFGDEDIIRILSIVDGDRSRVGEQDQLELCISSIIEPAELTTTIQNLNLEELLRDKSNELSSIKVVLGGVGDPTQKLAERIYDIRCRIVHSKSTSHRGEGAGLLPGTSDEDLVRQELPLMEVLAERALASGATKLDLRPHAR